GPSGHATAPKRGWPAEARKRWISPGRWPRWPEPSVACRSRAARSKSTTGSHPGGAGSRRVRGQDTGSPFFSHRKEASMRHPLLLLALVPGLALTLATLVVPSSGGPEKVKFPDAWKTHVMYTTVDRYDIKQFRELYASSPAAVDAMKAGQPLPDGT